MYIIIAGGGIAGSTLAVELANRKHDVVVIDMDPQACEALYASTGIITVNGRATEIASLKEAGIHKADVALGALYRDVHNLTFALLAHSFGVPRIIVKMRDPAYEEAYRIAGVTTICDMITMFRARVIAELETREIKMLTALHNGQTQLVMFQLPLSWPAAGVTVQELAAQPAFSGNCIFAGILNEKIDRIVVPHGSDRIYPGDKIFMVAGSKSLKSISQFLENEKKAHLAADAPVEK